MFNKTKPGETSSGLGIPTPPEPTPYRPSETARPAEAPRAAAPAPAATGAAAPARSSNLSTLSAGVNYEGNISGSGELQVDGKLKGDIRVARVVIGENGSVEGNVAADLVEIRGRVSGTVAGKSVKLFATSRAIDCRTRLLNLAYGYCHLLGVDQPLIDYSVVCSQYY